MSWYLAQCRDENNSLDPTITYIYNIYDDVNSLWPSDAIWWQRSGSTLAQVMDCCLMAPSHYLNGCWLIIEDVLWHSPERLNRYHVFGDNTLKCIYKFRTRPSLLQIMACHLFSTKPLPEPMLAYCWFNHWKYISVKFESNYNNFHTIKWI